MSSELFEFEETTNHNISYLLINNYGGAFTKSELLNTAKLASYEPKKCAVYSPSKCKDQHYDFVSYCEEFIMTFRPINYFVIYAPGTYLSHILLTLKAQASYSIQVKKTDYLNDEAKLLMAKYRKLRYSRPFELRNNLLDECINEINEVLKESNGPY